MAQDSAILAQLQRFGKALMLPIAILPTAGLLLGIGGALSNPDTLRVYKFWDIRQLQYVSRASCRTDSLR